MAWQRATGQGQFEVGFAAAEPFVSIEINNGGRLATEISQMAFQLSRLDDRKQVLMFRDVLGNW